jgi:hypothetical protein
MEILGGYIEGNFLTEWKLCRQKDKKSIHRSC